MPYDELNDQDPQGCLQPVLAFVVAVIVGMVIVCALGSCATPKPTVVELKDGKKVLTVTVPPQQNNGLGGAVLSFILGMFPAL